MNNFLTFIKEDVTAKKNLLSAMPVKTKTNINAFNEKVAFFLENYNEYKKHIKKYVRAKKKAFTPPFNHEPLEILLDEIHKLEHLRFLLNPTNTFFEKMGFDNLLFDIRNYNNFNFEDTNGIINKFLDKFELVGIKLTNANFNYTYYVREYMSSFLEIREIETSNNELLSKIFDSIYWENPELIEHIELSFRKLIKENKKEFNNYLKKIKETAMLENKINSYEECVKKLKILYQELEKLNQEKINDIIDLVLLGKIDIKDFYKESKVRKANYEKMILQKIDLDDLEAKENFHKNLEKLKSNVEEYQKLSQFGPLILDFKNNYEKEITKNDKLSFKTSKAKVIETEINEKETKLGKINKSILSRDGSQFKKNKKISLQEQKGETLDLAKELYELYKKYDEELFKEKAIVTITSFATIPELLHLYYSYDYFKKETLRKVFNLSSYDDIFKKSEEFDLFSMNPNNLIINGVSLFEKISISKTIVNRYRLDNINIKEEDLEVDNLNNLINRIKFLLRVYEVEQSEITLEQIWFMTEVKRLNELEK